MVRFCSKISFFICNFAAVFFLILEKQDVVMNKHISIIIIAMLSVSAHGVFAQHSVKTDETFPQLTNLPALYINTVTGNDPEDKINYVNCSVRLVDGDETKVWTLSDEVADDGTIDSYGIRGRGNSTWTHAVKKPWRLKFNKKTELLGSDFAKAKSWTLLANSFDKSLIRNALTWHIGTFVGLEFCPAALFVDLVMNGEYRGVYQISDQVEVREKRVPVDEDTGWLLEYCNDEYKIDDPSLQLNSGGVYYGDVQIKNPEFDGDRISSDPELAGKIDQWLNGLFMPSLAEDDRTLFSDPHSGYRSLVDGESLVNWYIATELTANWDGLYSIYMFRDTGVGYDTKMHFGPLWDEDLAFGNNTETYQLLYFPNQDFYKKLLAECNFDKSIGGYRRMQPVIANLWNDPWFAVSVRRRYDRLVESGLKDYLLGKIEEMRAELSVAAPMNFTKWRINDEDKPISNVHPEYEWNDYVDELKTFVADRIDLLSRLFAEKCAGTVWLSDKEEYDAIGSLMADVVFDRKFSAGKWSALCVPYSMSATEVARHFGDGARVAQFSSVSSTDNGITVLHFVYTDAVQPDVPCLVCPAIDVDMPFSLFSKQLSASGPHTVNRGGIVFSGTYRPLFADESCINGMVLGPDGTLCPVGVDGVGAFGAWFSVPETTDAVLSFEESTDCIDRPVTVEKVGDVFNLNGQRIGRNKDMLPKGVYISEGKKILVR